MAGGAVVNPRRHEFVCLVEFSGVGVLGWKSSHSGKALARGWGRFVLARST